MNLSHHASIRIQQRAIPSFVLDMLETCGSYHRCGGAEKLIFDKAARKRLQQYLGGKRGMRLFAPYLKVYAVFADDGTVVTAAHKRSRHRHH